MESVRVCATHFHVENTTVSSLVKDPEAKCKGRENVSKVSFPEEEHIFSCMEHGRGLISSRLDYFHSNIFNMFSQVF